MSKVGRPTKYKAEYADQAYKLTLLGATDAQLADFFGVTEQTFNAWKKSHPEFLESITRGKDLADAEIAAALYHRAKGYSHPEDKIFNNNGQEMVVPTIKHYPPDTQAASLWLRNRQPGRWRDKQQVEHSVDNDLVRRILDARQRNQ
jgi:DNA-binding XRE family transcriptional regulator